jgi:acetyl-CoA synthetase
MAGVIRLRLGLPPDWRSCHHYFVTESTSPSDTFRGARDLLLRHRDDYAAAKREFGWPRLDRFNWALDWFDVIAAEHPRRDALRIVAEGGSDVRLGYAELAARSNQVANWLRGLGVRRGDRVLVMLGNIAPLWEVILAAIKLGAVVIPATTLLGRDDIADRIGRGEVRHVITESAQTAKFRDCAVKGDGEAGGGWTAITVGEPVDGWHSYRDAVSAPAAFEPDGVTRAADPLLLYFTSGTTAQPKLVEHTHASYPAGHLSTMYWLGLQPGDVHLNISSPGWAKHAWSNVFAPWNAGATAAG